MEWSQLFLRGVGVNWSSLHTPKHARLCLFRRFPNMLDFACSVLIVHVNVILCLSAHSSLITGTPLVLEVVNL